MKQRLRPLLFAAARTTVFHPRWIFRWHHPFCNNTINRSRRIAGRAFFFDQEFNRRIAFALTSTFLSLLVSPSIFQLSLAGIIPPTCQLEQEDSKPPRTAQETRRRAEDDIKFPFRSKLDDSTFWNRILGSSRPKMNEHQQDHSDDWETLPDDAFDHRESDEVPKHEGSKEKSAQSTSHSKENGFSASSLLTGIASDFMELMGSAAGKSSDNQEDNTRLAKLIAKAREQSSSDDSIQESANLPQIIQLLDQYRDQLEKTADKYVSHDLSKLTPTALGYYVEYEDERKNPSWKRRLHRFCPQIQFEKVHELNRWLELSYLSYADTVEEIEKGLVEYDAELVSIQIKSAPGKPAHFIALPRNQSSQNNNTLTVYMCVRGTKTLADALTDLLCDPVEYREGKAHEFIVQSGQFLAESHRELFHDLLKHSKKKRLKIVLVGHSLGAGAATICGIELHHDPEQVFDVEVVGFGCPALLSLNLAEKYQDRITTVVNDSDVIPRLSGVSVANLLWNILEFNWFPYARQDVQQALGELSQLQPWLFNPIVTEKIKDFIEPMMEDYMNDTIQKDNKGSRIVPVELYPPGTLYHFYRDGVGFSGNIVPHRFFSEIDVTRRMIDDHLLHQGYQETFLAVMRQQSGDQHFRFDDSNKTE